MRDRRFVAEHRGGPLKREQHRQLLQWACGCAEHVLCRFGGEPDGRLTRALAVANEWCRGNASVGEARKAALDCIAVARESSSPAAVAVARSVGHAAATAHMADHALGAAWYALKAVANAGAPIDAERRWQDHRLPPGIRELVLTARAKKRI